MDEDLDFINNKKRKIRADDENMVPPVFISEDSIALKRHKSDQSMAGRLS